MRGYARTARGTAKRLLFFYVDQSLDWADAYGEKVPLLMAADVEVCRYFLDLQAFKTYVGG